MRKYQSEQQRLLAFYVRLWAKILPVSNGCWEWQDGTDEKGYGKISYKNYPELAHRMVLSLVLGKVLSPKELACHTCDNPKCCNPSHLFLGTHKDNTQDMLKKKRHYAFTHPEKAREHGLKQKAYLPKFEGSKHPKSKLTENDVKYIRANYKPHKVTLKELAKKFDVDLTTVSDIVRRKTWTHI